VKKRVRIAIVILLVALFAWAGCFFMRLREPEYQEKKLSQWLREIQTTAGTDSASFSNAARAVRIIGTNAIPTLLTMLAADDPRWKVKTVDWLQDTLNVDLRSKLASAERRHGLLGFQILKRTASSAIPELAARLTNSEPAIADLAFLALAEIDDPAAVPPLLVALTNANTTLHMAAATTLGLLRSKALAAVPVLETALRDPDASARAMAARAIGLIGDGSDQTLKALVSMLSETNAEVRASVAMALAAFGTRAEAALPVLRSLPEDATGFARRPIARAMVRVQCEMREGGIIRGPKDAKRIALVFTGHEYGEGGETILNALQNHNAHASFFLTGVFLSKPEFNGLLDRIVGERHYLGPHSDQHLLYCAWEKPHRTLLTEEEFANDLMANTIKTSRRGFEPIRFRRYFLPPFEHYNREIVDWTRRQRWNLINYTPGTRSHADYTGEADKNFTSSQVILDSIVKREQEDPHGLNGFILLLHIGSGPGRADKFHTRFGELLDYLTGKGYELVRVDELLEPKLNP
jgi:peptidoglycan/xylan/chitin deacetylase (PgdA/CDA1 family)/HEAT repeat protein